MLDRMRVPILLLVSFAVIFPNQPMHAQGSISDRIERADQLRDEGQPKAAIAMLEPALQPGANAFSEDDLGFAWNVLGSAYQDLEMFDKARRCYETAMERLRSIPSARARYAAVIANLASLEVSQGEKDPAKGLYEKAAGIYGELGNSAGMVIVSTSLASIAFSQRDYKNARRYLARALEEEQRAPALRDDDMAAMYSVGSALALHDGRYGEAVTTIQQAIDRWTRAHGASYFMLGLGYALRAEAVAKAGEYARALLDAQQALTIMEAAKGRNNSGYLRIEIVYAQILRASGAKEQASRLNKEASSSLAALESRECRGCTISVNSLQ
jgi:tetratricopeptide (TPR) repeat protein